MTEATTEQTSEITSEVTLPTNEVTTTTTKQYIAPTTTTTTTSYTPSNSGTYYSPSQFRTKGVIYYNGYKWTYYSQRVLPGNGLNIPGRHVDENGYVCDGEGYICLACGSVSKGTVMSTPLGRYGKVYDVCPTSGVVDVYVN